MKTQKKIWFLALFIAIAVTAKVQAQPSDSEREAFHAAMEACISDTGLSKPEPGVRPSEEDRQKLHACLEAKGIKPPQHRGGHGGRGPRPAQGQPSDSSSSASATSM